MKRVLWAALIALIAGCGGSGGGGTSNPLLAAIQGQVREINREDIWQFIAYIHPSFYEDCRDRDAYRAYWESVFQSPNYSYRLSNIRVQGYMLDELSGGGWMAVRWTVRETTNGFTNEFEEVTTFNFNRLNGQWLEIGDGSCP